MRKYINHFAIICAGLFLLASCIKDEGNYTYLDSDDVFPVKVVSGFPTENQYWVLGDVITLTPEITGMDDESNYDFAWYFYTTAAQAKPDTISTQRNLTNYIVSAGAHGTGSKTLAYTITDKRNGVKLFRTVSASISGVYGRGWYFTKDDGQWTDVDYISHVDGSFHTDLLERGAGVKLKGTAVMSFYQASGNYGYGHTWVNENGETESSSTLAAFHVLSSEDVSTFHSVNFSLYKNADEFFYDKPERIAPQYIGLDGSYYMNMVNDGKFYSYYPFRDAVGKLPLSRTLADTDNSRDYYFTGALTGTTAWMMYDRVSGEFLYTKGAIDMAPVYHFPVTTSNPQNTVLPCELSDYQMVFSINTFHNSNLKRYGYALMKNPSGSYVMLFISITNSETTNPIQEVYTVPSTSPIINADIVAANYNAASTKVIYYASGNQIWLYDVVSGTERLAYTLPGGETITYMEGVYRNASPATYFLAVATTDGAGNYTVRMFPFIGSAGELNGDEMLEFEGQGTVRHVHWRNSAN